MPFRSERQRRFMWANHPGIARRWTNEYGSRPIRGKKMASPKPGDKGYKGPVHEAVRSALGAIGVNFDKKKTAPKPYKKPTLTTKEKTQAAGNAVKFREMARRNATPGMSAQQANELERQSGLMATLPKRTSKVSKAKPKSKKRG